MGGEKLDTRNPTSKLMLTILAGVATWEREIMLERHSQRRQPSGRVPAPRPAVWSVVAHTGHRSSGQASVPLKWFLDLSDA